MATATLLSQEERQNQLARLQHAYPIQETTSGWEDFMEYFEHPIKNIKRFASVTHHGDFYYIYADYNSRCEAKQRAVKHLLDGIYDESPVAVVDLDLWKFWYPIGHWVPQDKPGKFIYTIDFFEGEPRP